AVTTVSGKVMDWARASGLAAASANGNARRRREDFEAFMDGSQTRVNARTGFPASAMGVTAARPFSEKAHDHRVGRYPGWRGSFHRLPRHADSGAPSGYA